MVFLKAFKLKYPFICAAILVSLVFSLAVTLVHLSLIADDFAYFARVYSPEGLHLKYLYPFIARVPLTVLLTWVYFHLPAAEGVAVPAILTFIIYSFSLAKIFSYFLTETLPRFDQDVAFWATAVILLYPTHYEILYWITAMPYIFGLALWALSLKRKPLLRTALLAAAFLVSEMYVMPALILPALILLIKGELRARKFLPRLIEWLLAMAVFFFVRLIIRLDLHLPSFAYVLSFNDAFILGRLRDSFYGVFSIHFFKTYWLNTALYWLTLLIAIYLLHRGRLISMRKLAAMLAVSFLTTGIYWIFDRNAPRALFGAQIVVCLCVFYFVLLFERKTAKIFLAILFLIFISATAKIFSVKNRNYLVLKDLEAEWSQRLASCEDPCSFKVKNLDKDIRNDWVLTYNSWPDFIDFIHYKYGIKKTLEPVFVDPSSVK